MTSLLLRNAELGGRHVVDLLVANGEIEAVGENVRHEADRVVDVEGVAVLPGLHDHHVHLLAWAAALQSLDCGPPNVVDRAALVHALQRHRAQPKRDEWIRGVGYHESVAGPLDRGALDAIVSDRPVRIQHRSGRLWVCNTLALEHLGVGDVVRHDGRLWDADRWLGERVGRRLPDIAAVGDRLAAVGVTGVTDATADADVAYLDAVDAAARARVLPQRVVVMSSPDHHQPTQAVGRGPVKVVLHESQLPPIDDVVATVLQVHAAKQSVAFHCVTRVELVVALTVLTEAGSRRGDRIEHGGVVPLELVETMRALSLTVVTQPNFIRERGDVYRKEVDGADLGDLYPCRRLFDGGVRVAGGTDAPFGGGDPWVAIAAAQTRTTNSGDAIGRGEAVNGVRALGMFLGPLAAPGSAPRRVRVGAPADLCVLDVPRRTALADPDAGHVTLTFIGGELVYDRVSDG